MRVLIGCEASGIVRDAFISAGHDAWSCDLKATERPGPHIQGDLLRVLDWGWDLAIFHPECRHLAVSGARWWPAKQQEQAAALNFVRQLMACPIPRWAIENPVGRISTAIRPADGYYQPWEHGHGETKKTGLWLHNLPMLQPSNIVAGRQPRIHRMPPGPNRSTDRSRTLPGVAAAMANQWGAAIPPA